MQIFVKRSGKLFAYQLPKRNIKKLLQMCESMKQNGEIDDYITLEK